MRFSLSFTTFLLLFISARSQNVYFNSEKFWNKLVLQKIDSKANISATDTVIIVASNRKMEKDSLRYLPEIYEAGIKYFVVHSSEGKWNIIPVTNLEKAINYVPDKNKDWVVYTEGMGKLFTTDVDRGMNMAAQYDVNVILFDYPSINPNRKRTRNYYFAKHHASISYKDFAPVLDTIKTLKLSNKLGNGSINLFFHSMGNIVIRQLVIHDKIKKINDVAWVNNLILNAPCVPQRRHKNWVSKIKFARNIYVHYNPQDFTLGGAYLMSTQIPLGMKLKKPICGNATYINFNTIAGKGHSNFLNLNGIQPQQQVSLNHYNTLFHGDTVSVHNKKLYQPTNYRNIGWDLLP